MCAALFTLTATLIGLSAPQRSLRSNLRTAGLLLGHAAPAALVLFLLFPRCAGPALGIAAGRLLGHDRPVGEHEPGQPLQPGAVRRHRFRAEFRGEAPPHTQRYWRGPVLWDFDGRTGR